MLDTACALPQALAVGPQQTRCLCSSRGSPPVAGAALFAAANRCFAACSDPGARATDLDAELPGLPPVAGDVVARLSERPALRCASCCFHDE